MRVFRESEEWMIENITRTHETWKARLLWQWLQVVCGTQSAFRPPLLGFACRRGERPFGPSRIRPCGLTAALRPAFRFARLASTSLPGRSAGLRSGLFWPEAKTIPPLHPSSASGRAVCLLGSGKPTVKTHTHECGSISSGWPPNQPASRIAKLFGEGGARGVGRSRG